MAADPRIAGRPQRGRTAPGPAGAGSPVSGSRRGAARAQLAHRADRTARRRQVHVGAAPGRGPGLRLHRAQPRDRAVRRLRHPRNPQPVRHARLPPLRASRAGGGVADLPRGGDRHARRAGVGRGQLQPAAGALPDDLAAGRSAGPHGAGARPGRLAPDGSQRRGHGRPQAHPGRPRGLLRQGGYAREHQRRHRGRGFCPSEPADARSHRVTGLKMHNNALTRTKTCNMMHIIAGAWHDFDASAYPEPAADRTKFTEAPPP